MEGYQELMGQFTLTVVIGACIGLIFPYEEQIMAIPLLFIGALLLLAGILTFDKAFVDERDLGVRGFLFMLIFLSIITNYLITAVHGLYWIILFAVTILLLIYVVVRGS